MTNKILPVVLLLAQSLSPYGASAYSAYAPQSRLPSQSELSSLDSKASEVYRNAILNPDEFHKHMYKAEFDPYKDIPFEIKEKRLTKAQKSKNWTLGEYLLSILREKGPRGLEKYVILHSSINREARKIMLNNLASCYSIEIPLQGDGVYRTAEEILESKVESYASAEEFGLNPVEIMKRKEEITKFMKERIGVTRFSAIGEPALDFVTKSLKYAKMDEYIRSQYEEIYKAKEMPKKEWKKKTGFDASHQFPHTLQDLTDLSNLQSLLLRDVRISILSYYPKIDEFKFLQELKTAPVISEVKGSFDVFYFSQSPIKEPSLKDFWIEKRK